MPYTDDPLNVPSDEVRFLVQDTNPARPELSDQGVLYLLSTEGTPLRAAARAAEVLQAKYAAVADQKRVGPLWLRYSEKSKRYAQLAKDLWAKAAIRGGGVAYAGGISVTDKVSRALDTDRTRSFFRRRLMRYRVSEADHIVGNASEILSPEYW